jgi:hypothetical protein
VHRRKTNSGLTSRITQVTPPNPPVASPNCQNGARPQGFASPRNTSAPLRPPLRSGTATSRRAAPAGSPARNILLTRSRLCIKNKVNRTKCVTHVVTRNCHPCCDKHTRPPQAEGLPHLARRASTPAGSDCEPRARRCECWPIPTRHERRLSFE